MIEIPKPPEKGNKTTDEYLLALRRWANRIYDAIRYMNEEEEQK